MILPLALLFKKQDNCFHFYFEMQFSIDILDLLSDCFHCPTSCDVCKPRCFIHILIIAFNFASLGHDTLLVTAFIHIIRII